MRVLLLVCVLGAGAAAQDLLVIAPDELAAALPAWRRHREAGGLAVAVAAPEEDLRAQVKAAHAASGGALRFVLLLGDVAKVPCGYVPADAIRDHERDPRIATDHPLSDLDGDDLPDLAVGRIPADNAAEAEAMLAKVVAYETGRDFSDWRRRVSVIAGVGGFGEFWDGMIERAATMLLKAGVPEAYELHVTYANPASPYCPPPARIADVVVERLSEGALIVTYMGHGSRLRLDDLVWDRRVHRIFTEDDVYRLSARRGAPILFLCACSTGDMDGTPDSLAEVALKHGGGPVAVIASTRVSMPYANTVLSKAMLDALFAARTETVGEMLAAAKRGLMDRRGDEMRQSIEGMAVFYKPDPRARIAELREHLFLYQLFGDPATRIARPAEASVECAEEARAGTRLKVTGASPVAGEASIELVAERAPSKAERAGDAPEDFAATYARANARVRAKAAARTGETGAFAAELALPEALAPGRYFVRVYVAGESGAAAGARPLEITE